MITDSSALRLHTLNLRSGGQKTKKIQLKSQNAKINYPVLTLFPIEKQLARQNNSIEVLMVSSIIPKNWTYILGVGKKISTDFKTQ